MLGSRFFCMLQSVRGVGRERKTKRDGREGGREGEGG